MWNRTEKKNEMIRSTTKIKKEKASSISSDAQKINEMKKRNEKEKEKTDLRYARRTHGSSVGGGLWRQCGLRIPPLSLSIDLYVYISISRSRSLARSAPSRLTRAIDTHSQSTSVAAEDGSREANSHSVGLTSLSMPLLIACQFSVTDEYRIDIVAAICSII